MSGEGRVLKCCDPGEALNARVGVICAMIEIFSVPRYYLFPKGAGPPGLGRSISTAAAEAFVEKCVWMGKDKSLSDLYGLNVQGLCPKIK